MMNSTTETSSVFEQGKSIAIECCLDMQTAIKVESVLSLQLLVCSIEDAKARSQGSKFSQCARAQL